MRMIDSLQNVKEEWAGGYENQFVGLKLLAILTDQGDICEVIVFLEISKCCEEVVLKFIPFQV